MEKIIKVNSKIWNFLENSRAKTILLYGGSGGGKSWTLAQFLILEKALQERNKWFLFTRKTNPSVMLSVYALMKGILDYIEVPYEEHRSQQYIKMPTSGSVIYYRGLDDPEKIKSTDFNYIWMEEATEFTLEDYLMLRIRLKRPTGNRKRNQLFLTFNPVNKQSWIYREFFAKKQTDVAILHTTYHDNPFLTEEDAQVLEALRDTDEDFYRIYTKGEWVDIGNVIFKNWDIVDKLPERYDEKIYGVDFGFNNPTAVVEVRIKDKEIYVKEILYASGMTNDDLIAYLQEQIKDKGACMYGDSAEPARIEEIHRAGFNIYPAEKDVLNGIDFLKRHKIYVFKDSQNLINELSTYKWRQDKNGNILDQPVKENDHLIDALRYAVYTHLQARKGVNVWTL